jgi:outer membrane protein
MASTMPDVFDPALLDVETLVERALSSHPTMRLGSVNMEVAEKQHANARAQRLPTLSLGLPSYSFGETERGLFDAWGKFGAPNNSFSFNLNLSYPLFNGFSTSANIASSREAEQDRRYALEQTRQQVEKNVRTAMIDLDLQHSNLRIAQQAADNAQLRLDLAQEQYRLGAADFTILQQIIQQNDDARRQVLNAQFQFLNARVTLEEAIGGPMNANQ